MKVGIITFHNTLNYGANLQAYALYKTIESQGHQVEIINYCPSVSTEYYQKDLKILKKLKNFQKINIHDIHLLRKWLKITLFTRFNMNLSRKIAEEPDLHKIAHKYQALVCGSDQIWSFDDSSFRDFDQSYFLGFTDTQYSGIKISYAPSCGNTQTFGVYQEQICQLLNQFNAISVRDFHSLNLLKQECNQQAVQVLDPTFLIKEDYNKLLKQPKDKNRYLLIYHQKYLTDQEEKFISSLANTNGFKILSMGKYCKIAHKNIMGLGIDEWLGYFNSSSYVFTNTFHGTIFSIIFRKPFTVVLRDYNSNKIMDLVKNLGMENRVQNYNNQRIDELDIQKLMNIDYTKTDQILKQKIENSKQYLIDSLITV